MSASPAEPVVLCAVDLGDLTSSVLAWAARLAEIHEAKLVVVHSVELWDKRYDFIVPEIAARIQKDAGEKLQAEVAHLRKSTPVPLEVLIEKGFPEEAVLKVIRSRKPQVVVIGSHGRRGLEDVLLGSVADKLLRISPCPVLVVRPGRVSDLKNIVCSVDFSECSRHAVEYAIRIAKAEEIPVVKVLHVFEVPIGYMEAGMTYELAFEKTKGVHQKELDEFLKPFAGADARCVAIIEEGSPASTIARAAEKSGAELLVIGAHDRSRLTAFLFGGISMRIVHQAKLPVLVVKSPQQRESLWQALDHL